MKLKVKANCEIDNDNNCVFKVPLVEVEAMIHEYFLAPHIAENFEQDRGNVIAFPSGALEVFMKHLFDYTEDKGSKYRVLMTVDVEAKDSDEAVWSVTDNLRGVADYSVLTVSDLEGKG